ncbi:putative D-tyrosyl-tRNA(Tyr) deacylase [Teladorsagia circumcincta]|uniref:Putative D-tyrosyl-tRNA(Tyr) deacylase n=1 Tax=Teladorsagia circumcincta TaxID=45464 RepID=A0A2G9V460_TELCI|nr:putative D-tyrosyl-tRNA(Tyr) deacylase [Teladorsagia circumcincta]
MLLRIKIPVMYIIYSTPFHPLIHIMFMNKTVTDQNLRSFVLENMSSLFRRLSDDKVEDKCMDLIVHSLRSDDSSVQASLFMYNDSISAGLVQRIVTRDPVRMKDASQVCVHLLNPLVIGLSCKELSSAHFDDVMSSVRILLDLVEQLRYESDDRLQQQQLGLGRLGNRRVSMSSTNLPRVMISAARPSFSNDSRKMSFLSADGRLEDRGRRESRDSRGSLESDMSIRIGNSSDVSDDSCHSGVSQTARGRRQSWLECYAHSMSLEQGASFTDAKVGDVLSLKRGGGRCSERRARTRSPNQMDPDIRQAPARPNSFTNLGHNLGRPATI